MPQQFDVIWRRFIGLCVEHLPWDAMVDFQAHVWPAMHVGQKPDVAFQARHAELTGDMFTSMRVLLHGREIELRYFPAGQFWRCCGRVCSGLDRVLAIEFSPRNGILARGAEHLDALAMEAIAWLQLPLAEPTEVKRHLSDAVK